MMSDFHYTIIVVKRIDDNNIITISIENLKKKLSVSLLSFSVL